MGVGRSAEGPCLGTRVVTPDGRKGDYVWKTYREVERLALEAGSGLLNGDFVPLRRFEEPDGKSISMRCIGIFARNREEWVITEHASNAYGVTVVPLYDTLGPHSTRFILGETQMKTVVADGDCLGKLLDALEQKQQHGEGQKQQEQQQDEQQKEREEPQHDIVLEGEPTWCLSLTNCSRRWSPSTLFATPQASEPHGTTGSPKGVMMSHGNFVAAVATAVEGPLSEFGLHLDSSDCLISYLPLAHVYERFCENLFFSYGGRVGFYSGDTHKLLDDVQTLKPTVFCSVPRLFQRIEERVTNSLQGKSFLARSLFQQALAAKIRRLRSSGVPQHPVWDKVVFDKFKNLMGGRVRIMLTGSAPLDPQTLERMRAFFCCWIVEGYGMTETMGASFLTWNVYDNNPGQVGGVLPSLEFCLLDVSETMNKYSIRDSIPKGELCVRGSTVFAGYFRNKKETENAIDKDGWLHTGDIAALLPNGGVQIIDRKKNIFKLAQGEYVAPEKIEAVYMHSRFVSQCFVFGFSSETSLVAVVVADPDQTLQWLRETRGTATASSRTLAEWLEDPGDAGHCNSIEPYSRGVAGGSGCAAGHTRRHATGGQEAGLEGLRTSTKGLLPY
ncbi:LOW QUALITY PROTEIN: long-chain fatty acid CoA ligase, putative [Eimeria mitis]|uniref:Long-chain fatty acid CoA ligase, putative n=1 Tax=Eimeria mitis TaxID=44415 RepID=U6KDZ7_9EIME|nr:LOW QUALITY PROTEIN: long-chain fatty acid CoA ligase, putative [Eimeria mitis]CDJ36174.1 long-chain fatty acid CoA ligase, putative [Eimeria mitis]